MFKPTRCNQKRKIFKDTLWQNVSRESAQVLFERVNIDGNTNPNLDDYGYDANDFRVKSFEKAFYEETERSSMIFDRNKGITEIGYNHLNLPTRITWTNNKYITYQYNALGQKVSKSVNHSDTIKTVNYLDGFQYAGNVLQFFPTSEGYVKATPIDRTNTEFRFNYIYNYTDHFDKRAQSTALSEVCERSSVRVSYTLDPQTGKLRIVDEHHYYPFGLRHEVHYPSGNRLDFHPSSTLNGGQIGDPVQLINVTKTEYMYKLKGMEYQDELGLNVYDFGARMYMPDIGRWNGIDAKAEQYRRWSPYNYCVNNPIVFSDPDGMGVETDFYNLKGNKIGTDGVDNGVKVVVTNNKEARAISKTKGNVDASSVTSGVTLPSNTALQESLNVLDRTVKNGGLREESSLVMKDGVVVEGKTGSMPTIEKGVQTATASLPSLPEGSTASDVETSIHSHPTVVQQVGEQVFPQSASTPSPTDNNTFKQFETNIIVGPLGTLKPGSVTTNPDGSLNIPSRPTGAAIYDSSSTLKVELEKKAIENILKN